MESLTLLLFFIAFLWIAHGFYKDFTTPKDPEAELNRLKQQLKEAKLKAKEDTPPPKQFKPNPIFFIKDSTESFKEYIPTPNLMFISAEAKRTYLSSKEWQDLKQQRMAIANNQCEVEGCTETHNLQLHHEDYTRLTQELIEDVKLICPNHHQEIHDKLGYDRQTLYPISILKD